MGILYSCIHKCVHFTQKKSTKLFLGLFALMFLGMGNVGWGQVLTEGFESGLPTSYTATTSYVLGSGTWTGQANGVINNMNPAFVKSGTLSCQLRSQTGAQISTLPITWGGISTISFWASASTTSGSMQLNYSTDGGTTWTAAPGSPFSLNLTVTQFSSNLNIVAPSILIQFYRTNATVYIDDVNFTFSPAKTSNGSGDWNNPNTWSPVGVPANNEDVLIRSTDVVHTGTALTRNASTIVNGGFQVDGGGYASGTNFTYASVGSKLIMNHNSGLYGINTGQAFWPSTNSPYNVTIQGTGAQLFNGGGAKTINGTLLIVSQFDINAAGLITVNGTLQINSGYISSIAPIYSNTSTLIYNTGGTYGVGTEWTGNSTTAGTGVPQNVTIQSASTIDMPNTDRGMAGNLNITSGTLNLNGGSGDLYIAGNWSRASGAAFTPNNRAVFFNGNGTQTVTVTGGGTENFDYLLTQNSSTLTIGSNTDINVNKTNGLTLSSTASSTIDLKGRTFALPGGGNLSLGGGMRNINSSSGVGIFLINAPNPNPVVVINGGSLSFNANTNLKLTFGIDCGTGSLVTINNQMEIAAGGFVQGNSPRYGMGSLLLYSGNTIYNRTLEWTSIIAGVGTPGLPYNLKLSNGAVLNYINVSNPGPKGILGNLTIDNVPPTTSSLYMDYGSVSSAGDLTVAGNVTVSGNLSLGFTSGDDLKTSGDFILNSTASLNTNNRAIYFIKDGTQNLTSFLAGTLTLPKIILGYPGGSGTALKINQNTIASVNVANWDVITFTNATDIFDLNGKTLTIGQSGFNNTIAGPGSFRGSASSNISLSGNGNAGTFNFVAGGTVLNIFSINRTNASLAANLGSVLTIGNQLILTAGFLNIAANNLYFNPSASVGGSPSLNSFIQADGTGYVIKDFTGPTAFTFPVGDATGTVEYSPAFVTFSSGTFSSGEFGLNVVDAKHPNNNVATNYITRYWNVTSSGITNILADLSFIYVPADVVGPTEANINTGGWDGTNWYQYNSTNAGTHTLSVSATTSFKNSYTGGDVFSPLGSLITDYFRSKSPGGNWSTITSWESSTNGVSGWHDATVVPTSASNTITVLAPHTIIVNSTISLDQTVINGILQIEGAGKLNLDSGGGDDITINSGGIYLVLGDNNYDDQINYVTGAVIHILSGGKIAIGNGANVIGKDLDRYATEYNNIYYNIWDDGAIYEWNNPGTFGTKNLTYFPKAPAGIKPIFRVTKNGSTPGASLLTTINGIFEVNDNVTFSGAGPKTFRDGIIGTATLKLPSGLGTITLSGDDPILGGSNLLLVTDNPINLNKGLLVPAGANVKVTSTSTTGFSKGTNGIFQVDGILDLTDVAISNTSGSLVINGTLKTSRINGLYNPGNIASGIITLNPGSTIEYNAIVAQQITSTATLGQSYYNITFSGSGTKTPTSAVDVNANGTVKITGTTIVDASSNNIGLTGANTTKFIMDGGRLLLGTTGALPLMDGVYTLTGGVIQYNGSSNEKIRDRNNKNGTDYQNIEVTGTDVSNSNGNINLNTGGTFTIKTGGILMMNDYSITGFSGNQTFTMESGSLLKVGAPKGFSGPAAFPESPVVRTDIETITLQPNSTVEYYRSNPPFMPNGDQDITNTIPYQNLIISGNGNKTAPSSTLTINGNFTKSTASNFVHNGGTVLFNGTSPQTYLSVNPIMTLYNMTNNSNNLIINDTLAVLKKLILTDPSKVTLNNDIVMKSNDTTTANIAEIVNATIVYTAGRFIVERYIPNHSKAWQLLAVPTKGNTINEAWQEGSSNTPGPLFNRKPGYGTTISSNVPSPLLLGFDMPSFSPSMKTYNSATDNFTGIPNTTSIIDNRAGYFLFVRGDRNVTGVGQPATSTILRTRGKIYAPTPAGETPTPITVNPNSYTSVGNPYASSIDFYSLTRSGFGIGSYYIFDPQLTTSGYSAYGYGGYRTISFNTSVPSGGNYVDGNIPPIQSGQAFFVDNTNAAAGSISFPEMAKVNGSRSIFRAPLRDGDYTDPDAQLRGNLFVNYNNEYILIDGELTQFQASYDTDLDGLDARKLMNTGENMGITSNNITLAIERRPMPLVSDTLFYQLSNMKQKPYRFEFIASKMDITGLEGYVYDQYLKTETTLNMSDTTYIDFNVTGDAHSSAANRFMIYFKPAAGPVPVTFTNVNAHLQNKDIVVEWKTENEKDMNGYTLQASLDGTNFKPMTFIKATNNGVGNYTYTDADALPGYHYYRVQSVDANGKTALTRIVKVWVGSGKHLITIYPNPIRNNEVNLQFEGQVQGAYKARLLNSTGQVLAAKEINFAGGSGNETIQLDQYTAHGVYHLEITQPDGKKVVLKVMK